MTQPPAQVRPLVDEPVEPSGEPRVVPSPAPRTAVILAAGSGSRFRSQGEKTPKPLIPLGGLPLVERAVRTARRAGVERFVIVVGCRGEEVRALLTPRLAGLDVRWVLHAGWPQGNGSSLLAAKSHVGPEPFLVMMADHVLLPGLLEGLLAADDGRSNVMAVDRKRHLLLDPEDATKVRLLGGQVVAVGKRLGAWDAIDTGAAICTPAIFEALEEAARADGGACSHSDGMRRLAARGLLRFHDVGDARWEDVDEPRAHDAAERLLLDSLRKPSDGFMSRVLERRLSLAITRRLAPTRVTPNQMTLFSTALGLLAALLFAQAGVAVKVAAALLLWCSSFTDGCDGELARLRFQESRLGGWLDFCGDNLVHLATFAAMGVGLWRDTGEVRWAGLGAAAALGVAFTAAFVSFTRLRRSAAFTTIVEDGRWPRARRVADALGRRDFIFGLVFLALIGALPAFLWAAAVGTYVYLALLVVLHTARRPGA
jgi:CDP-L-myo-inositol myo-inositolphosphotransferase